MHANPPKTKGFQRVYLVAMGLPSASGARSVRHGNWIIFLFLGMGQDLIIASIIGGHAFAIFRSIGKVLFITRQA